MPNMSKRFSTATLRILLLFAFLLVLGEVVLNYHSWGNGGHVSAASADLPPGLVIGATFHADMPGDAGVGGRSYRVKDIRENWVLVEVLDSPPLKKGVELWINLDVVHYITLP